MVPSGSFEVDDFRDGFYGPAFSLSGDVEFSVRNIG